MCTVVNCTWNPRKLTQGVLVEEKGFCAPKLLEGRNGNPLSRKSRTDKDEVTLDAATVHVSYGGISILSMEDKYGVDMAVT